MNKKETIRLLKTSVDSYRKYRKENPEWNPDLSGANLSDADLRRANLNEANLIDADLRRTKFGFNMPTESDQNDLLLRVANAALKTDTSLSMGRWHTCDTTHCIAGWACFLSEEAKEFEKKASTYLAARIFLGEDATKHFYDSNEEAKAYLHETI